MKNLNEELKRNRIIATIGLVGALAIAGCDTPRQARGGSEQMIGATLQMLGMSRGNPQAVAMGRAMSDYGRSIQAQEERGSGGDINVHVYNQPPEPSRERVVETPRNPESSWEKWLKENESPRIFGNSQQQGIVKASRPFGNSGQQNISGIVSDRTFWSDYGTYFYFAANSWEDIDGEGNPAPFEFFGVKNRFKEDEKLILVTLDDRTGLKGHNWSLDVYSPQGMLMYGTKGVIPYDGMVNMIGNKFEKDYGLPFMNHLVKHGGYGNYKAVWKIDGEHTGSNEFEIIPK